MLKGPIVYRATYRDRTEAVAAAMYDAENELTGLTYAETLDSIRRRHGAPLARRFKERQAAKAAAFLAAYDVARLFD